MDLSKIERPEGVSPTAMPVLQWDTASCNGDLGRRKQLLDTGWEPVGFSVVVKPSTVLTLNGTAKKEELVGVWGFRRVRQIMWVETMATEQSEQATA